MAAVTIAAGYPQYTVMGTKQVVISKFTSPADGETWDTGLGLVEAAFFGINEADDAGDAVTAASISGATITLGVAGTVGACFAMAIGT